MSTSRHPVALRLERLVGGDARLLALVMGLPLIDGIFPALILAGALDDPIGALQVGLLIFGGSATLAVILAEMDGTPREQAGVVLLVGVPLVAVAAIQAALAPAIASVLDLVIFERFAALVIGAIAAKTASATVGDYLPGPGIIIGLGLLASLDPTGVELAVLDEPALVAHATAAAGIGVLFALGVALCGPHLRERMDIDRFRFGSAVALGLLPLSLLGMPFGNAPLAVLGVAALFALEPGNAGEGDGPLASVLRDGTSDVGADAGATAPLSAGTRPDGGREDRSASTDGPAIGGDEPGTDDEGENDGSDADESAGGPYPGDDTTDTEGRAPWL